VRLPTIPGRTEAAVDDEAEKLIASVVSYYVELLKRRIATHALYKIGLDTLLQSKPCSVSKNFQRSESRRELQSEMD